MHVGASLEVMERDARKMFGDGPFMFSQVTHNVGVPQICEHVLAKWKSALAVAKI